MKVVNKCMENEYVKASPIETMWLIITGKIKITGLKFNTNYPLNCKIEADVDYNSIRKECLEKEKD